MEHRPTLQLPTTRSIRVVRPIELEVCEGPAEGARFGPLMPPVRVGAAPGNDVAIDDPSVSRHHALLEHTRDGLLIRDTGSTNGVFLGGFRVLEAILEEGTIIVLGRSAIRVRFTDGQPELSSAADEHTFGSLVGRSPAMQDCLLALTRVASTRLPVLINGETGTGKELAARALHLEGADPDAPFVVVDCGAAAPQLLQNALFGDADSSSAEASPGGAGGAFVAANGGTLFLDEVGELPIDLQPRLLRALEEQSVTPLGSNTAVPFDVRVIASTHRDLRKMVNDGRFREDLYYRIAVAPIRLPPLRDRTEDVVLLGNAFYIEALTLLEEASAATMPTLDTASATWLERQAWPGNVRELKNVIQRAVILGEPDDVQNGRLADALRRATHEDATESAERRSLEQAKRNFERAYLLELLRRHDGNRRAAAEEAQIHPKSLQRLVRRHGLKGEVP